jgi:hypothetical protein
VLPKGWLGGEKKKKRPISAGILAPKVTRVEKQQGCGSNERMDCSPVLTTISPVSLTHESAEWRQRPGTETMSRVVKPATRSNLCILGCAEQSFRKGGLPSVTFLLRCFSCAVLSVLFVPVVDWRWPNPHRAGLSAASHERPGTKAARCCHTMEESSHTRRKQTGAGKKRA